MRQGTLQSMDASGDWLRGLPGPVGGLQMRDLPTCVEVEGGRHRHPGVRERGAGRVGGGGLPADATAGQERRREEDGLGQVAGERGTVNFGPAKIHERHDGQKLPEHVAPAAHVAVPAADPEERRQLNRRHPHIPCNPGKLRSGNWNSAAPLA